MISFYITSLWYHLGNPHLWYDYLLEKEVKGHIFTDENNTNL